MRVRPSWVVAVLTFLDFCIKVSLFCLCIFLTPQFKEHGKTKVGRKQGVGGLRTLGETFDALFVCFDIFVFFFVVFMQSYF